MPEKEPGPPRPTGAGNLGWRVLAEGDTCPWAPGLATGCPAPKGRTRPETQRHTTGGADHHPRPSCQGQTMPSAGGQPGLRARAGGGWSHHTAGSAAPLLVILPTHGLDSRAQLPTLATPVPGSPETPDSARPPWASPEAPCPPEGSPECAQGLRPWGAHSEAPGMTCSPVLATTSCGDHPVPGADRGPPEGRERAAWQPQAPALAQGQQQLVPVWCGQPHGWSSHLHERSLQPGPAGGWGYTEQPPGPASSGSHLPGWGKGANPPPPSSLARWVPAEARDSHTGPETSSG